MQGLRSRGRLLLVIGLVGGLMVGGVAWWGLHRVPVFPAEVREGVSFGLFYPRALPRGFAIDKESFHATDGVVIFSADGPRASHISFTVQRRPPTFDFDMFYKQGLSGATEFITPSGQAAMGRAQDKLVGSLVAEESWVLVSPSAADFSESDMKRILLGLKKS